MKSISPRMPAPRARRFGSALVCAAVLSGPWGLLAASGATAAGTPAPATNAQAQLADSYASVSGALINFYAAQSGQTLDTYLKSQQVLIAGTAPTGSGADTGTDSSTGTPGADPASTTPAPLPTDGGTPTATAGATGSAGSAGSAGDGWRAPGPAASHQRDSRCPSQYPRCSPGCSAAPAPASAPRRSGPVARRSAQHPRPRWPGDSGRSRSQGPAAADRQARPWAGPTGSCRDRSEEHTSELQSH